MTDPDSIKLGHKIYDLLPRDSSELQAAIRDRISSQAAEVDQLKADAEMFRWLVENGECQWSFDYTKCEISFRIDAEGFGTIREAISLAMKG